MFDNYNSKKHGQVGLIKYDFQKKLFSISEQIYKIYETESINIKKDIFGFFRRVAPAERKMFMRQIRLSIKEKSNVDFVYKILLPNKKTKSLRLCIFIEQCKIKDSEMAICTLEDISYYAQLSEKLKILSTAIEQSPSIISIADTDGKIKYINRTYSETTGYTFEEVHNKNFNLISAGIQPETFYKNIWKTLKNGEIWRGEFVNKRKNGETYYSGAHIFPILDSNNEINLFVATEKDITEQKKQDEINIIQQKKAQMGEMISMIAHQWRQPLSSIGTLAALMKIMIDLDDIDKDSFYENIEKINNQVQFLSNTINDFRNFFNPNNQKEEVLISDVVQLAVDIIGQSIKTKNIHLIINSDKEAKIEVHKNELIQVILNLLKNAQDALLERKIDNAFIKINATQNNDYVTIEVLDNAGGIPDDIRIKIFDPYFSTKNQNAGTGLGLYMSKTIIEEHCGGNLNVESIKSIKDGKEVKKGTKFIIKLPNISSSSEGEKIG